MKEVKLEVRKGGIREKLLKLHGVISSPFSMAIREHSIPARFMKRIAPLINFYGRENISLFFRGRRLIQDKIRVYKYEQPGRWFGYEIDLC